VNGTLSTGGGQVTVGFGTLGGTGIIRRVVVVPFGTISPGSPTDSAGHLTVAGLNVTGTARFNLNGTTPGTLHDRITVTDGVVALGGDLVTTLGYTPSAGDKLFIINNTGIFGTFGQFNGLPQGSLVTLGTGEFTALISYEGDVATNAVTGGDDVVLHSFAPVPEPASLFAVAAVVGAGCCLRRRRPLVG
jgi:hypothetical protein